MPSMQVSSGLKLHVGAADRDGSYWACRAMEAGGGGAPPTEGHTGASTELQGHQCHRGRWVRERDRALDVVFPSCPTKSS